MINTGNLMKGDRFKFGEAFQKRWPKKFLQWDDLQRLCKFNTYAKKIFKMESAYKSN